MRIRIVPRNSTEILAYRLNCCDYRACYQEKTYLWVFSVKSFIENRKNIRRKQNRYLSILWGGRKSTVLLGNL
jgi:hypothetical protein